MMCRTLYTFCNMTLRFICFSYKLGKSKIARTTVAWWWKYPGPLLIVSSQISHRWCIQMKYTDSSNNQLVIYLF